jgi:ribosomal protein L30E
MKIKFYCLFIAVILSVTSLQAQGQYFVYSITGTASVLRNNKPQPLKILDKVLELDKLSLGSKSGISLVNVQTKKLYQISQSKPFVIREVIKNYPEDLSTSKKTIEYVIANFIEKGKVFHEGKDYSSVGMATRGVTKKPLLFPWSGTSIYLNHSFVPQFDSALTVIENKFFISFSQDKKILSESFIKQGDTLQIPTIQDNSSPIVMTCKWRSFSQSIDLNFMSEAEKAILNAELLEIENDNDLLKNPSEKILAKAIYLEAKNCFIDAAELFKSINVDN